MEGQTRSGQLGQSLIEALVVVPFVLVIIIGGLSLSQTLRTQMKHHFVDVAKGPDSKEEQDVIDNLMKQDKNLVLFPQKTTLKDELSSLEDQGWVEDKKNVVPGGEMILFRRDSEKMMLLSHGRERLGMKL